MCKYTCVFPVLLLSPKQPAPSLLHLGQTRAPCPSGTESGAISVQPSRLPASSSLVSHTLLSSPAWCGSELGREFLRRSLVALCHRSTPHSRGLENTLAIKRSPISFLALANPTGEDAAHLNMHLESLPFPFP